MCPGDHAKEREVCPDEAPALEGGRGGGKGGGRQIGLGCYSLEHGLRHGLSSTDHVICAHGKGLLSNGVEHVGGVENPIVVCERVYISTIDSGRGID